MHGEHFTMGAVSLRSIYDPANHAGELVAVIEPQSNLSERKALAQLLRQFADDIEHG